MSYTGKPGGKMNMDFEKLTEAEKEDLLAKATSLETMSKLNLPKDILDLARERSYQPQYPRRNRRG